MFQDSPQRSDEYAEQGGSELELDVLRAIIQQSAAIPHAVAAASFSQIQDRFMDKKTIASLSQSDTDGDDGSKDRLRRRRAALGRNLGKRLVCVLIYLPGVYYTIEVDPAAKRIIHWEWEAA